MPAKLEIVSSNSEPELHRSALKFEKPGFGSRHVHDDAPFTLWQADNSGIRSPSSEELKWIEERYQADRIDFGAPDMMIHTRQPPQPMPFTLAAMLVRFIPTEPYPNYYPVPEGDFKPLSTTKRNDLLAAPLRRYEFPSSEIRSEIIQKLRTKADIRVIHFFPPLIIVEIDVSTGRKYERKSLPAKAGGLNIMYHVNENGYWKGTSQKAFERLTIPTSIQTDYSIYLQQKPFQLSPGVCLSSAFLTSGGLLTSQWRTTTSGVLLQNGAERRMMAANHGFQDCIEVHHPNPQSRRIGEIAERSEDWDIALVRLDPSISFSNRRYFEAPSPRRLVPIGDILCGDWFEADSISTGRIDLCARLLS